MTTGDAADRPLIGGRLRRVLDFLRDFTAEHGYPPSMRETANAVGLTSTSSVAHHLGVLEGRGYITRTPGTPRGITIVDEPDPDLAVAVEYLTEAVGGIESDATDAAATLVNVGDVRRVLRALS